jgi:hypothetical protein
VKKPDEKLSERADSAGAWRHEFDRYPLASDVADAGFGGEAVAGA